jgi:DNA polymerase-1
MAQPYTLEGFQRGFKEAYQLMHDGSLALSQIENNGIRIDVDYCHHQMDRLQDRLDVLEERVHESDLWRAMETASRKKRKTLSLSANDTLEIALFDIMGLKSLAETDKGKRSTSADALRPLIDDAPGLDALLDWRRWDKARNTFLAGILREQTDGLLHPLFNLNLVVTYRSSSNNPNFQNFPSRDAEVKKIIRRAFIPREGRMLGELDYSGVEVTIAACYHQDPAMLRYILDPSKDMHRDMAAECYMLPPEQVTKMTRYSAKNGFVFPQFYGDWFKSCAKALWENIDKLHLATVSGTPLKKHLASKGIKTLKQFTDHVEKVEKRFWGKRFPVYAQWKDDVWDYYLKHGHVNLFTGFRCSDIAIRNEVINRPIQGTAFHCLLWALVELQKELRQRRMKSLQVGQIHDAIVADIDPDELDPFLELAEDVMVNRIREEWGDWLILPLEIEAELTGVDKSWFTKKEVVKNLKTGYPGDCGCCSSWMWEQKTKGILEAYVCPVCGKSPTPF